MDNRPTVLTELADKHIVVVTLNRPEAANALNWKMLDSLSCIIDEINLTKDIRVAVITGKGKIFCAGADLKERRGMDEEQVRRTVRMIGDTFTKIENSRVPVIAAVNGHALGGGLELALACCMRVADENAKMSFPEVGLAIIPGAGGTQRLARLVGIPLAKEMIYTGKALTGREAFDRGLVNHATASTVTLLNLSPRMVLDKALETARIVAAQGPIAIEQAKKAINNGIDLPLDRALELESELYERCIGSKDRLEGLKAFAEKRNPVYTGE